MKEPDAAFVEAMKKWTGLLKEESDQSLKVRTANVPGAASECKRIVSSYFWLTAH